MTENKEDWKERWFTCPTCDGLGRVQGRENPLQSQNEALQKEVDELKEKIKRLNEYNAIIKE